MVSRRLLGATVAGLVLGGCSVGLAGLGAAPVGAPAVLDAASDGTVVSPPVSAPVSAPDATPAGDSGDAGDAGDAGDVVVGPNPCGPTSVGPEEAHAFPSLTTKVIDGLLGDWGCETPLEVTGANAAKAVRPDGGVFAASMRVRMEWDKDALYVAFEVTDPAIVGTNATDPYNNDSVELYLRGSTAGNGNYGPLDHHYGFDHKNLAVELSVVGPNKPFPASQSIVKLVPGGYVVEVRVDASAVGGPFLAGRSLGLDLHLNDGINQPIYLIWAMNNHGACGLCTGQCCCTSPPTGNPYCDLLRLGTLTLQ